MRPQHARNSARTLFTAGIAAAIVAGALIVALTATITPADAASPIEFGLSVRGDNASLLNEAEQDLGRSVDTVRTFALWDDSFPTNQDLAALDGRNLILSIKPQTDADGRLRWADIAAAQPGEQLYEDMVRWANALKPYEDQIWITFHHEPEARSNLPHGNAEEFKQAWRTFNTVLADHGFDPLGRVWIMTDFSFQVPAADRRHAEKWYPGDEWVEALAADAYNWFDCRAGAEIGWLDLEDIIEEFRQFGLAHPDEQLMLTEFGSVEDRNNPARKAQWFADAQDLFKQPGYGQFTTLSYFSLNDTSGNFNCDWRFTTSPQSQAALAALVDDPFYGGGGTPPPPPEPPPMPPPVVEPACVATANGAGFDLAWNEVGDPVIRRNGGWLATPEPGTTSYFDSTAPPDSNYEIRIYGNGPRLDLTCTTETAPAPPPVDPPVDPEPPVDPAPVCVGTVDGNTITLEWDLTGTNIVRRNGAWLATTPNGATNYTDTTPTADSTYLIRNRPAAGGVFDHECELNGEITPPPPPIVGCTATATADGVTLSWDFDGQAIVRKNGNWLTTVTGTQNFTDTSGMAADSYLIRSYATGTRVDHNCG